ncbi:hypothetical protein JTE90_004206 [Oedothorax gibbosus]|uniref:Uncharacterized protein n=1 Tax=Oedothorax gibbosus TaxID=931172 RepID=A0AAV6V3Z1_9ARAC|nr:hypothetical protein JTE90_004206 [Oedothorax gibbosus]
MGYGYFQPKLPASPIYSLNSRFQFNPNPIQSGPIKELYKKKIENHLFLSNGDTNQSPGGKEQVEDNC